MGTKKSATNTAKAEGETTEKPARKQHVRTVPPIRKLKDNPAGHFEDSVRSVSKRAAKIARMTAKWAAQNPAAAPLASQIALVMSSSDALADTFKALAASGTAFKVGFPRSSKVIPLVKGQKITLSAEGLDKLHLDFPSLTVEHDVRISPTYADGQKDVPVVLFEGLTNGDGTKSDLLLGRVSRKSVSPRVESAA